MDVFNLRDQVVHDYAEYVRSFVRIREPNLRQYVSTSLTDQALWPEPLIQMNPSFQAGGWIDGLVEDAILHTKCKDIFRIKSKVDEVGSPMRLHKHQVDAVNEARARRNYVLTTGTGSGKSLSYIIPIVDHVLRNGSGKGIQAIVVYPMNALCNSQYGELEKFLRLGFGNGNEPVSFERYTGQETQEKREEIVRRPPDILLTNYVMLELLLTRPFEQSLINSARGLSFLVLDELHTYRGRQGADVALLVRRVREACRSPQMLCVGTSATMASGGSYEEQRSEISQVATRLFGVNVDAESIVGETLTRETPELDFNEADVLLGLKKNIAANELPQDYNSFTSSIIASWLESSFGLRREEVSGRLIRAQPKSIRGEGGAADQLSVLTGESKKACEGAIQRWLLAGYNCNPNPETKRKPFAFRLHQFISRGDAVFASLEDGVDRRYSLSGQQFVPGSDREKILLPLAFCRECGAEYYSVWMTRDDATGSVLFRPRELTDRVDDPIEGQAGFLYRDPTNPWPTDETEILDRLPDDWLEEHRGRQRVRSGMRDDLPRPVLIDTSGKVSSDGRQYWFTNTPFRFCQHCGVSYRVRRGASDFGQLATLGSGGRSTATTILSISSVRLLRDEPTLEDFARKLLSFTDNRQDASLQAGHFNDFVEVSLLRSAIYKAALKADDEGLAHDELAQRVYKAMNLDFALFAADPGVEFAQRANTERAFRNVLAYRMYRDQKRGWRITSPNLEQSGLLRIEYPSLSDLCRSEAHWNGTHIALVGATSQTRERICRALLDFLRRELAIDVEYLTAEFFERLQQQSSQLLRDPWAIDEQERHEITPVVFPRGRRPHDRQFFTYVSGRSGFGIYLGRQQTLPEYVTSGGRLTLQDKDAVIRDLFRILCNAGFVSEQIAASAEVDDVPGYQLKASAMTWHVADGTVAFHDPIRVPNPPAEGGRTNSFFVEFYKSVASKLRGLEAKEHTAQVPYQEREKREQAFGNATLPVLYCSPTMELGVDIRQLNVVNMRNVPPTPANYAQRSGRAGRSGQPAFVLTYCTTGSSHDQYFFRQPDRMVAGAVSPPRLDMANEDLVRAHVNAVWLAETGEWLGNSLTDLLDVEGLNPTLKLLPSKQAGLSKIASIESARTKAASILKTIATELSGATWYTEDWLSQTLDHTIHAFEDACDRWRSLFRAAKDQLERQNAIIGDVALRAQWPDARRLRREAEAQIELLTDSRNVVQSDFYSYRYFASEGFLPGYNFPRLPLSAFIPARRRGRGQDEFLSRPRFLAVSEFGPQSIIYHEGSRYVVNKVILPIADGESPLTTSAKQCEVCGYMHELAAGEAGPDCCENCNSPRLSRIDSLLRLQNVATRRRDRINSDEEERIRMGYELRTGLRFKEVSGLPQYRIAQVKTGTDTLFDLTYGDAATIWRINLGWRRRRDPDRHGFLLDTERGYWQRNEQLQADDDDAPADPTATRTSRVVPFVEDRRNCLIIEPSAGLNDVAMATLQAAIKKAIQAIYQLEDNELAAEPLPASHDRRQILIYESAEGGAGVLRRIVDDSESMVEIAKEALRLCHFDPVSGDDLRRAKGASEDCEAGCYDCLMSYSNQRDHEFLDRHVIKQLLLDLRASKVEASPAARSHAAHLQWLKEQCDSELEKQWLDFLAARSLRLPTSAQKFYEQCGTRPDFIYDKQHTVIYIDGPPHDFPDRQKRDALKTSEMEDCGFTVLRFHHQADWNEAIATHPNIFGIPRDVIDLVHEPVDVSDDEEFDLDLFQTKWQSVALALQELDQVTVEPGGDVSKAGRVVGSYALEVSCGLHSVYVVDEADASAVKAVEALNEQGSTAIAVDPSDSGVVAAIRAAIGGGV